MSSVNFDPFDFLYRPEDARHYEKNYDDPQLQDTELCALCGGICCKRCGCFLSPDDFPDLSEEGLKREIDKGYLVIEEVDLDMIYMDGFAFIIRVRNVTDPVYIGMSYRAPSSPCILLGEHGCKLDWEHRPAGGKLLVPAEHGKCWSKYGLEETVREWKPYQRLLVKLGRYYDGRDIPCTL